LTEPPLLAPPTILRFDVRGTVVAHLIDSPFGGSGYTRMDGARELRARTDTTEEPSTLQCALESDRETPEEPLGKTPPESK
jgi:hypothetical protein